MAHWWETHPWRMVQTNLREIDMADIDAVVFAQELKEFGATVVNLNAAGIIASYDTKLAYQPRSQYLTGDSLLQVVDACHAQGIRVIARTDFSRIRREVYEQHPDWAARLADGDIVDYNGYVSVCPNSEYQNRYLFDILKELFTSHPFDGLYCNMSSFYLTDYNGTFHGVCQCDVCRGLYKKETGRELPPAVDPRDPALADYIAFLGRCSTRHKAKLTAFVKALNSELAIDGVDFMRSEVSVDYGRPNWVYKASSNSRLAAGPQRARPSDDASVDFTGFRHRHISAPPALMALRQWQNLANSGCLSLYIMGRLDNHRDVSGFEPTRRVFQFHKAHEDVFAGLQSAARTVLLHTGGWKRTEEEAMGWVRILTESHIPFDEMPLSGLGSLEQLAGKQLLVLPDIARIPKMQAALIDAFARAGGTVLATGGTAQGKGSAPLQCLGVANVRETRRGLRSSMLEIPGAERATFPRCVQAPYVDFGDQLLCIDPSGGAKTYLRLIPEHPFGPPECCCFTKKEEIPGLVVSPCGFGRGVYLPWKGGALYQREGLANPFLFLQDVLFGFCGVQDLAPGLTPMVELVLCQKEEQLVVQLVNGTGCFANSWFAPVPVRDIHLSLPGVSGAVRTLNGGRLTVQEKSGALEVVLDVLDEYEAIVIQ